MEHTRGRSRSRTSSTNISQNARYKARHRTESLSSIIQKPTAAFGINTKLAFAGSGFSAKQVSGCFQRSRDREISPDRFPMLLTSRSSIVRIACGIRAQQQMGKSFGPARRSLTSTSRSTNSYRPSQRNWRITFLGASEERIASPQREFEPGPEGSCCCVVNLKRRHHRERSKPK